MCFILKPNLFSDYNTSVFANAEASFKIFLIYQCASSIRVGIDKWWLLDKRFAVYLNYLFFHNSISKLDRYPI